MCTATFKSIVKAALPANAQNWARKQQRKFRCWPPVGWVRFGGLRRLEPISRVFGLDRGQPIDRHYIEVFLQSRSADIRGRVLEVGDPAYTRKFGGNRVSQSEELHIWPGNPQATLTGDLTGGQTLPKGAFDCLILTQTLHFIYALPAAVSNAFAALKPKGVLLATLPGISQISRYDMDRWGDCWRLTDASAHRLFGQVFGPDQVQVITYGNVLAAIAGLHGLAAEELSPAELNHSDPDYQLLVGVRAERPAASP